MHARPQSLEHALELLGQDNWTILAGGTDYYPGLRDQAPTDPVIDITSLKALDRIAVDADLDNNLRDKNPGIKPEIRPEINIGALTTWSSLVAADLPQAFDALKEAALEVGSVQIQNRATLAGNLCNASPAADGVPPLLCLDAEVELTSVEGIRRLPVNEFIQGNRKTARRENELLTAIVIPAHACRGHSSFIKLGARRYLVISISMVAVNIELGATGQIERVAIAVGSCSEVASRLASLESSLIGMQADDCCNAAAGGSVANLIETAVRAELSPIDDVRASGQYRYQASSEMVSRALTQAVMSAQTGQP